MPCEGLRKSRPHDAGQAAWLSGGGRLAEENAMTADAISVSARLGSSSPTSERRTPPFPEESGAVSTSEDPTFKATYEKFKSPLALARSRCLTQEALDRYGVFQYGHARTRPVDARPTRQRASYGIGTRTATLRAALVARGDVGFIDLNRARKQFQHRPLHHRVTQPVRHSPHGLIRDLQVAMNWCALISATMAVCGSARSSAKPSKTQQPVPPSLCFGDPVRIRQRDDNGIEK